jgi:hypothetical protein
VKPTSNAPFMSSSDSGSKVSSSSSNNSDNERSTNRALVISGLVIPSDSEDDGFSPSQHKLAMKKQLAKHDVVPDLMSGSDEEAEEVEEEEEVEQSIDGQSSTSFESTSYTAIFSRITGMIS